MGLDIIKSYLVALGFQVNNSEFDKANKAVDDLGKTVQSVTSGMTRSFVGAAGAIVGAIAAVTTATAGMIDAVSKADLQYEKLALHMYTTKQVAKELKTVLDTMGESMDDVAWIPELRQKYFELLGQARQMETPADAAGQLKDIRSITFEFQRMKLEATYAMQWIAYYLTKYLSGPLGSLKGGLKGFNDWIVKEMPTWTNKVAQWLVMIINLGKAGIRFVGDFYSMLKSVFDMLPQGVKLFVSAMAILGAAVMTGPFGWFVLTLGTILILLEDFYGYMEGRRSSKTLAPMWDKLISLGGSMKEWKDKVLPDLLRRINDLVLSLGELNANGLKTTYTWLSSIIGILTDSMKKNGVWYSFQVMLSDISDSLNSVFKGLINIGKQMDIIPKNTSFKTFWQWFGDELARELKVLSAFGRAVAGIVDMIGLVMQGNYAAAAARGASIFPNLKRDLANSSAGGNGHGTSWSWGGSDGSDISKFMEAIGQKESGGNYDSPEHMDAGHWNKGGKYQILAENWPQWTVEAGLPSNAPYTAENQEIVAKNKMQQLYQQYGDWSLVAAAWNGGGRGVDSYSKYGQDSYMNGYVSSVMGNFRSNAAYAQQQMSAPYATGGSNSVNVNISGGVNVQVMPGDDPQKYYAKTMQALEDKFGIKTSMEIADMRGVTG
jgi:hypothetical protein